MIEKWKDLIIMGEVGHYNLLLGSVAKMVIHTLLLQWTCWGSWIASTFKNNEHLVHLINS